MSNFIPSELKRIVPRDPPWITKPLKCMINRKNRLFKNFKRHGFNQPEAKIKLDNFRIECQEAVENAKLSYLTNLGKKLHNPNTSHKCYWKIINTLLNKCKAPKLSPLLVNNLFIINCKEKAKLFTDFFSRQCKPVINDSFFTRLQFPDKWKNKPDTYRKQGYYFINSSAKSQQGYWIRWNNSTHASVMCFCYVLLLFDESIVLPLKINFSNIL